MVYISSRIHFEGTTGRCVLKTGHYVLLLKTMNLLHHNKNDFNIYILTTPIINY
jgi:hypothetical protein